MSKKNRKKQKTKKNQPKPLVAASVGQDKFSETQRRARPLLLYMLIAVFAVAGAAFYFSLIPFGPESIKAGDYKDYNVLLITMDTTRADHLPMYGYKNVKTPNLDDLAAHSFVFEDAISQAPLTLPA